MSVIKVGNFNLTLSDERVAYAQLRLRYLYDARFEQDEFAKDFFSLFIDADDLFSKFPSYLQEQAREVTEDGLADITAHQIYDIDEAAFGKRLANKLASGQNEIERLFDKYRAIGSSAAELEAERAERAANGPRVIGGGFGIEGAARGIAEAAVANVAIGLVQGIANAAATGVSSVSGRRKKAQLFADPATRDGLAEVVFDVVYRAHLVVAEIVNERSAEPVFAPVTLADAGRAAAFLSNVSKDRVPVEERPSVLFRALGLDPFSKDIWFEWLNRFGDQDGSLAVAAEAIGIVELPERKGALVAQRLAALPQSTPEECQSAVAKLNDYAAFLGFDAELEQNLLIAKAEELDEQRRSYRGEVFATEEEAKAAEEKGKLNELEALAREFSSERLRIERRAEQLVITEHSLNNAQLEVALDRHLRREAQKLQPYNEKVVLASLVIVGALLAPVGGTGLVLILAALLYWRHKNGQRRDAVAGKHPGLFTEAAVEAARRP